MRRRAQIRADLKKTFNQTFYNPYRQIYHVDFSDPAVERFMAAQTSRYDYWKPTWEGFFLFFFLQLFPILALGYYLKVTKGEFERKCRSGEITFHDRPYRRGYVSGEIST